MLENMHKKILIKKDIATVKKLNDILSKGPKIIHFICHGDYSQEKQRFYLAFENESAELQELDS
jgi:hypothetical protein